VTAAHLRSAARPAHFQASEWLVRDQQREFEGDGRKTAVAADPSPV